MHTFVPLKVKAWLEEGKDVRFGHWEDTDGQILSTFHLLTDKPVVYLVSYVLNKE